MVGEVPKPRANSGVIPLGELVSLSWTSCPTSRRSSCRNGPTFRTPTATAGSRLPALSLCSNSWPKNPQSGFWLYREKPTDALLHQCVSMEKLVFHDAEKSCCDEPAWVESRFPDPEIHMSPELG